jgi:hypothetical protein
MAQDRHPRGPQRGETQFTTKPSQKDWSLTDWVLGCILPLVALGAPLLFLGSLALYGFFHGFETTTSSTSTDLSSDLLPPTLPTRPQPYYAEFQVHDGTTPDAHTVLTIKDELIRIITVSDAEKIPKEKSEAAARGAVVDGVRPTVLVGAVTVTVAALEQQDQWASVLLFADGDLRQALLKQAGEGGLPRPPPGFEVLNSDQSLPPAISQMVEAAFRPPLPIREIYIVGQVQAIHAPSRFHESRSTTNIIDLDVRAHASQIAAYERALVKYVNDTRRYEHRYDPDYIRVREKLEYPNEEFKHEHIEHPVEAHPFAIP